ncbi:Spy/CpxP family protein refolding chaperone [Fibrobacter sp. UBA4297]|uniref:Spy/CpxP family protein refolding chaperone n=1 Tax=Fibrobacter sp. UBA4297 TaxID=1946536 RepID=UPI0025B7DD82|nr:Spy/CpxP family protein refolding chaperone [Fibrobacter sp. UBA4297]
MNASTKTFIASLIILACSLGFAIGAFVFAGNGFGAACHSTCTSSHKQCVCGCENHSDCDKNDCDCNCCKRGGKYHGKHHGERFHDKDFRDGRHDGPRDHFKDGRRFDKKFDFKKGAEFMDSVLQVTHEQKAALEQQRHEMDSAFKDLRKQKKNAEKALHDALDSNDEKKIAAAKVEILKAQEALLNHRIKGVKDFNKILTKEQLEKFKSFHKDHKHMKRTDRDERGPMQRDERGPRHHDDD